MQLALAWLYFLNYQLSLWHLDAGSSRNKRMKYFVFYLYLSTTLDSNYTISMIKWKRLFLEICYSIIIFSWIVQIHDLATLLLVYFSHQMAFFCCLFFVLSYMSWNRSQCVCQRRKDCKDCQKYHWYFFLIMGHNKELKIGKYSCFNEVFQSYLLSLY